MSLSPSCLSLHRYALLWVALQAEGYKFSFDDWHKWVALGSSWAAPSAHSNSSSSAAVSSYPVLSLVASHLSKPLLHAMPKQSPSHLLADPHLCLSLVLPLLLALCLLRWLLPAMSTCLYHTTPSAQTPSSEACSIACPRTNM